MKIIDCVFESMMGYFQNFSLNWMDQVLEFVTYSLVLDFWNHNIFLTQIINRIFLIQLIYRQLYFWIFYTVQYNDSYVL